MKFKIKQSEQSEGEMEMTETGYIILEGEPINECPTCGSTQNPHLCNDRPKKIEKLEYIPTNIDGTSNIGVNTLRVKLNELIDAFNSLTSIK